VVSDAVSRIPSFTWQDSFSCRFDWGPHGLRALAPRASVVVIVDVFRFTTAVSVAVDRGASVYPYRWNDGGATAYAADRFAMLAGRREAGDWSLSPTDLTRLPLGSRLVLPSPNGSALAFAAREHGAVHVLAGCVRNAKATARTAHRLAGADGSVAVIAAGERWNGGTGALRPAVEDLLGAGAIIASVAALDASWNLSPEAAAARSAFEVARDDLQRALLACASGSELVGRGWADDVETASVLDASASAAVLVDDAFVAG
jgi:2-phosphosulfolactate phosphatase